MGIGFYAYHEVPTSNGGNIAREWWECMKQNNENDFPPYFGPYIPVYNLYDYYATARLVDIMRSVNTNESGKLSLTIQTLWELKYIGSSPHAGCNGGRHKARVVRGRSLGKSSNSRLEFLFADFLGVQSNKWRSFGISHLDEAPTLIPNVNMSSTIERYCVE
jgi:hypothetical protein